MADPLVEVRALTRRFGEVVAVDALDFGVDRGELFGIVGPDGAGKTTTLRMLAGVMRPTSGEIRLLGESLVADPEAAKHRLAYMPQRFGLYEDLTVRENLDFYADLFGVGSREREPRIARLHAFSGLGPFQDRLAGQLSGGMKQKLALSCALVHQPDLLLLDEPTFGVDPISRRDLWLILHEMVETGVTVIVSTSYLDEAERCDRVALLDQGRIIALDSPAALQRGIDCTLFEVHTTGARAARDALRAVPGVRRATLFGDAVHVLVEPDREVEAGLRDALSRAGAAGELRRIEPSLEDLFIELVSAPGIAETASPAAGGRPGQGPPASPDPR